MKIQYASDLIKPHCRCIIQRGFRLALSYNYMAYLQESWFDRSLIAMICLLTNKIFDLLES